MCILGFSSTVVIHYCYEFLVADIEHMCRLIQISVIRCTVRNLVTSCFQLNTIACIIEFAFCEHSYTYKYNSDV